MKEADIGELHDIISEWTEDNGYEIKWAVIEFKERGVYKEELRLHYKKDGWDVKKEYFHP